jgi:hypothetical protein
VTFCGRSPLASLPAEQIPFRALNISFCAKLRRDRLHEQTSDDNLAYPAEIGIPKAALDFIFARGADDLEWLTLDVARKYGIQVMVIP